MNHVTRRLGKASCSVALALAFFAMPVSSMSVEAASYVSSDGEMENVQATAGDGSITFSWDWTEEFAANGYANIYAGSEAILPTMAEFFGIEYPGNTSAFVIYTTKNLNESLVDVEDINVNTWAQFIPNTVTTWTFEGLVNGQEYYFSCYADADAEEFVAVIPVAKVSEDEEIQDEATQDEATRDEVQDEVQDTVQDVVQNEETQSNATQNNATQDDVNEEVTTQYDVVEEAGPSSYELYMDAFADQIEEAEAGSVVQIDGGTDMTALPNSLMRSLYEKGNVGLEFSFEYEGKEYTVMIPAGKAVNDDIPWYGHLYLLQNYGK